MQMFPKWLMTSWQSRYLGVYGREGLLLTQRIARFDERTGERI